MALGQLHFETSDGKEIVTPYFQDAVTRKEMKKVREAAKAAGGMEELDDEILFEAAKLDKKIIAILDDMSLRDFTAFIQKWMGEDEGTLGK